jgi:predicted metal-dependent hydrolase
VAGPRRIRKKHSGPFGRERCGEPPPRAVLAGIEELNRGLYFEQHETLEELWKDESDDSRYLYQGILLVGVGLYHLERDNYAGATTKLRRGVELLEWFRPSCQGVDVEALVADATRLLAAVEALGRERLSEVDRSLYPRVHLVEGWPSQADEL